MRRASRTCGPIRLGAEYGRQAIELARQHGWTDEPIAGVAYAVLAAAVVAQGRLEEAEAWLEHAERTLQEQVEPAAGLLLRYVRGGLELARGRDQEALAAFRSAERLAGLLVAPHDARERALRRQLLQTLVRMGETDRVERAFAEMDAAERDSGEMRTRPCGTATRPGRPGGRDGRARARARRLRPRGEPQLLASRTPSCWRRSRATRSARRAPPRAPSSARWISPSPTASSTRSSSTPRPTCSSAIPGDGTSHASLIAEILNLLAGGSPTPSPGEPEPLREPLSDSEKRILRYLPTHLSAPEIAGELYLSVHTVKSHMLHLYAKLGTHRRAETVERARALGLLAPSSRQR